MKYSRLLHVFCSLALLLPLVAFAKDVRVKGYTKKDGTYVAPHTRSAPNGTKADNFSTEGNVNPYTGEPGTKPNTDVGGIVPPDSSLSVPLDQPGTQPLPGPPVETMTDRELLVATLQEVRALRARVVSLERQMGTHGPANSIQTPAAGALPTALSPGLAAWRRLQRGMVKGQVHALLGDPTHATADCWSYKSGWVMFFRETVSSWSEPTP